MIVYYVISLPGELTAGRLEGFLPWQLLTYYEDSYLKRTSLTVRRIDSDPPITLYVGGGITTVLVRDEDPGGNVFSHYGANIKPKLRELLSLDREREVFLDYSFALILSRDRPSRDIFSYTQSRGLPKPPPIQEDLGGVRAIVSPNAIVLLSEDERLGEVYKLVPMALSRLQLETHLLGERVQRIENRLKELEDPEDLHPISEEISTLSRLVWQKLGEEVFTDPGLARVYRLSLEVLGLRRVVEGVRDRLDMLKDTASSLIDASMSKRMLEVIRSTYRMVRSSESMENSLLSFEIAISAITLLSFISVILSLFQMAGVTLSIRQAYLLTPVVLLLAVLLYVYLRWRAERRLYRRVVSPGELWSPEDRPGGSDGEGPGDCGTALDGLPLRDVLYLESSRGRCTAVVRGRPARRVLGGISSLLRGREFTITISLRNGRVSYAEIEANFLPSGEEEGEIISRARSLLRAIQGSKAG